MTAPALETDLTVEETETEDESVTVDYNIASYPSDFTLSGIAEMWKDGDIVVPDYQRRFVWSIQQSSSFRTLRGTSLPSAGLLVILEV